MKSLIWFSFFVPVSAVATERHTSHSFQDKDVPYFVSEQTPDGKGRIKIVRQKPAQKRKKIDSPF